MNSATFAPPEWRLDQRGGVAELRLSGDWIALETGTRSAAEARQILERTVGAGLQLRLDASNIGRWDSALIAFLKKLRDLAGTGSTASVQVDQSGLPEAARQLIGLALAVSPAPLGLLQQRSSFLTRAGLAYFGAWSKLVAIAALVGEAALRGAASFAGRARMRAIDVLQLVREAGAGALGIVSLVSALVGAIIAFIGAVQLQRFGAGIFVANLVGIAIVREMAAIATAIVMAGRTGGAYAAQLATMQGNEEIDALNAFGIPIFDFLVLPRIAALVSMMPLLYLYGCAAGLFGGFVVSIATVDLTPAAFLEQLRTALDGTQFAIGLIKSIAFGALVALASCHIGLTAGRSAEDVGHAATTAVVAGIVGIIVLDAVFAVGTNALGI